jgi:hypothetical protein
MKTDLLDVAVEIAINPLGGHAEAKDRLQQRFPHTDFDTITEAYLTACQLHELAYDAADKHRDGVHSRADALAMLQERCAGFSQETYRKAFAQGLFESR